jgi:hypothetical protein
VTAQKMPTDGMTSSAAEAFPRYTPNLYDAIKGHGESQSRGASN